MGLAASQARFLGITLRKANCEFRSTELAQQRLELTNQMTDISQEYANALNSTKLVWHNDAVCDSFGNPTDFGLSYSLLMMPSAANDYNPYMVSTRTGAIILNSKYAQAAKDAGISMGGSTPSEEGRNKFLKSLSQSTEINGVKQHDNVITETTYKILTETDGAKASGDVKWHSAAGMGAAPKDKGVADATNLVDLMNDSTMGGRSLDWLQIERGLLGLGINEGVTDAQMADVMQSYRDNVARAKLDYINNTLDPPLKVPMDSVRVNNYVTEAEKQAQKLIEQWKSINDKTDISKEQKVSNMKTFAYNSGNAVVTSDDNKKIDEEAFSIIGKFAHLEAQIELSQNESQRLQFINALENLKKGYDTNGVVGKNNENLYKYPLYWSVYEQTKISNAKSANGIAWKGSASADKAKYTAEFSDMFQTSSQEIADGKFVYNSAGEGIQKLSVAINDVVCSDAAELKSMTISDLLSQNIVLMARGTEEKDSNGKIITKSAINSVSESAGYLIEYIASVFGYGHIGTGLNVDPESDSALKMALASVQKQFLKQGNAIKNGGEKNDKSLLNNSAYTNCNKFNRIGSNENGDYAAVNLSNMVSAFLTYFDNYLRASDSGYVVGKGNTVFVTDDAGYVYVTNTVEGVTNDEKIADFFNELYNNICEHGWRYDDMVQDNEYLESAVKDGRYQLMALNNDAYFYQMRYNEIGYMEEVQDEDAIARAEADYQTKKAQITFKEDQIDIKTKKLDAEITELNTEINSVQNIIAKSIEKTFSMFSN